MRGLHKSTGYWQTVAAKKDWEALAEFAVKNGLKKEADKLTPPDNWGWRRIDKRIAKLREALRAIELEFVLPSRR
jgi:hypothetical protein